MLVIAVSAGERAENLELFIEQVVSVAPVSNAIVDYQLLEDLHSGVAVERQIFTIAVDYLAVFLQPVLHAAAAGALVA